MLLALLIATPNFPAVIQAQVGSAAPPRCSICHATDAGGGAVVQPFGQYLVSRGLQPYDEQSLRNALAADAAEHHHSASGQADLDALKAGLDPNGASVSPSYGCSSTGGGWLAIAACLLLILRWRWKPIANSLNG